MAQHMFYPGKVYFHVHLRMMFSLLLLGSVFYRRLSGLLCYVVQVFSSFSESLLFILFGICQASHMCTFMFFNKFEDFSAIMSLNVFCLFVCFLLLSSPLLFLTSIKYVLVQFVVSDIILRPFSFFFIRFFPLSLSVPQIA